VLESLEPNPALAFFSYRLMMPTTSKLKYFKYLHSYGHSYSCPSLILILNQDHVNKHLSLKGAYRVRDGRHGTRTRLCTQCGCGLVGI